MLNMHYVIEKRKVNCPEVLLFEALGFKKPYPFAQFYTQEKAGNSSVLRLTPISINTTHNDAIAMHDPSTLAITEEEYQQLSVILSDYFEGYGFTLKSNATNDWLLFHDREIKTHSLYEMMHQSIFPLLPTGKDKSFWHRLITECQMLCHQHDFLLKREEKGKPNINGFWFWGESHNQVFDTSTVFVTDEPFLLDNETPLSSDNIIKYDGHLEKSLFQSHNKLVIYVSELSDKDKKIVTKLNKNKKNCWNGSSNLKLISKGSQDENNIKKRDTLITRVSSFITTFTTYIQRKRPEESR